MPRKISKKGLRKKVWDLFSVWVRKSVADFSGYTECYTCELRFHWKEMNAGHYRHDSHDFDPRNVKAQCVNCNLGEQGRADKFYLRLIKDYGEEIANELRDRAKWNAYTTQELQGLLASYQEKVKALG